MTAVAPIVRPATADETLRAVRAERARRSLAACVRYGWHVLEPTTPLIWNWHLQAMCDHVQALYEGRIACNALSINVPPGSSKSRIFSVFAPAWWWIDHADFRSIFSSANPRVVIRDSVYTRDLITSRWYQESFRPTWRLTGDQNAKVLFRNTAGGFRLAIGSGARVTGDRANGLFMDDMLDAAEAESRPSHDAFATFYDNAFANRVSEPTKAIRGMISQRLHENDPAGHVVKVETWAELVIRQEYEVPADGVKPTTAIGWCDPRSAAGELMDPVRFPRSYVDAEKRRLGTRGFAAQHQQRPSPAEGAIIKRAWIKRYHTPRDEKGNMLPPRDIVRVLAITRVVQGVDTALSVKSSADNTADATIGEAPNRYYMLDLFLDKVDAPTGRSTIIGLQAKWGAAAVVIEGGSSASGKAAAQSIKADTRLVIIEQPVMGDKVVGMNKIAPAIEAGLFYVPDDQEWAERFIESLIHFPTGEYDDDDDAVRIALDYLIFGGGSRGMLDLMSATTAKRANDALLQGAT